VEKNEWEFNGLKRPVLRFTITDKKEYVDPRTLEGYKTGDTVALILGEDLIHIIDTLKGVLNDYIELQEDYEEAREVIKKHIQKQGGG